MKTKDMPTRAREHARVAARQSIMKGIPASDAGVCFMAEGLAMIYGLQPLQAVLLVQRLIPYAFEIFKQQLAEQHGAHSPDSHLSPGSDSASKID
jgi:hypothetical protein